MCADVPYHVVWLVVSGRWLVVGGLWPVIGGLWFVVFGWWSVVLTRHCAACCVVLLHQVSVCIVWVSRSRYVQPLQGSWGVLQPFHCDVLAAL